MKRRQRREVEGNGRKRKGIPPASSVPLFSALLEHGEGGGGERACSPGGGSSGDGVRECRRARLRVAVGGGHVCRAARGVPAGEGARLGAWTIEGDHAGRERGVEGEAVLAVAFDVGCDLRAGVAHRVDHAPRIGMAGQGFLPRLVHRRRKGGAAHGQDGDLVAVPGLLHHPRPERAHRAPFATAPGRPHATRGVESAGDAHARNRGVARVVAFRRGLGGGTRTQLDGLVGTDRPMMDGLRMGDGLRRRAAKGEQSEPGRPGDSGPDGDGFLGRHKQRKVVR